MRNLKPAATSFAGTTRWPASIVSRPMSPSAVDNNQAGRRRRCCMRESAYWDGETGCVVAAMGSIAGGREGSMMGGKDVDGDGLSYK